MALHSRMSDSGELPVYCRLTYKQQQKRFMIGCKVPLKMWNQSKQRANGKSLEAQTINQQISSTVQKVHNAELELLKRAAPFEVEDIINLVQGRGKTGYSTVMQVYQYRLKQMKKLEGIDFKASTIRKFVEAFNSIKLFLKYQYNSEDMALSKLNIIFLQNLEMFLKTERGMKLITLNKVIQRFKSVVTIAINNGWLTSNPFPGHRFKHERLKVVYLTVEELERLEHFQFTQPRLARVRDIFLFSVYTGLHYIDAMSLTDNNIIKGVDGKEWIEYVRQKTDKTIYIPLLEKAKDLIRKFRIENEKSDTFATSIVPRISNQKMNSYLKEVAEICGINKSLTHKIARKTFGSVLLYYDIPMKVVSELMGHSSVIITERHYAQVELKRLGQAMATIDNLNVP